ncbi:MAG: ABC transporter permease [Sphaerochaetaceae bacterium]|jgi:ribose transport system permease protein|nr:ABC transporter permease [Sphaerochaetaceae bacterium]MDD4219617.1 ABC transporter permease [Sphaerochaetaceae bacterium]MDY0371854.1 ABC transporter permease [Sphaerochaetaceae bacterium]
MKSKKETFLQFSKSLPRKPYFLSMIILIFFFIMLGFIGRNYYSAYNLTTKFRLWMPLLLVALGQTFVILGGGLDMSVSSLLALVNVVTVRLLMSLSGSPFQVPIAILAGIGVGITAGFVNGLLVTYLRLPPLISTYGTQIVWGGLALRVLHQSGGEVPFSWYTVYSSTFLGIPFSVYLLALLLLGVYYLKRTGFVTQLKACGGNIHGAYESVLPVNKLRIQSYMLCGFFASLAAICIVAETVTGNPLSGSGYELESISAVALGGTSLAGGAGGFLGSILGAIVLKLINDVIFFAGLGVNYQVLAQGLIIILALAAGGQLTKQNTSRAQLKRRKKV